MRQLIICLTYIVVSGIFTFLAGNLYAGLLHLMGCGAIFAYQIASYRAERAEKILKIIKGTD